MSFSESISAVTMHQLVYMCNTCDHWKQIKLKESETTSNADESSKVSVSVIEDD